MEIEITFLDMIPKWMLIERIIYLVNGVEIFYGSGNILGNSSKLKSCFEEDLKEANTDLSSSLNSSEWGFMIYISSPEIMIGKSVR
jgi:hypothetical protein